MAGYQPRDWQRKRLYRADETIPQGQHLPELEACQAYIDRVTRKLWWRRMGGPAYVKAVRGRLRGYAKADTERMTMALPPDSPEGQRDEQLIIHELAHFLVPDTEPVHGAMFANVHLELTCRIRGRGIALLLAGAYVNHGVRFGTWRGVHDRNG